MKWNATFTLGIFLLFSGVVLAASPESDRIRDQYDDIQQQIPETQKTDALSMELISEMYEVLVKNPVSALSAVDHYDPTKAIGYCYGRAMSAHLTASRYGLKNQSMRKLFIIGDMRSNPKKREWRFHVTTVLKNDRGEWIAVDPVMDVFPFYAKSVPVADWIAKVRGHWDNWQKDENGNVITGTKLYLTSVNAVIPDLSFVYKDVAKEPGDRIIQLNFDPEKQNGFAKSLTVPGAYQVSAEAEEKYFQSAHEAHSSEEFDFVKVMLTYLDPPADPVSSELSYYGYFSDLMGTFIE